MAIVSATMLAEIGHGLAAAQAREARQPFRRAQEVERIDAAHGLEQPVDLAGEAAGLAGDLAGEQRLGEDVVGEVGHVDGDVEDAAVLVALGEGLACASASARRSRRCGAA